MSWCQSNLQTYEIAINQFPRVFNIHYYHNLHGAEFSDLFLLTDPHSKQLEICPCEIIKIQSRRVNSSRLPKVEFVVLQTSASLIQKSDLDKIHEIQQFRVDI